MSKPNQTIPAPEKLAHLVDPATRDYIDAKIAELKHQFNQELATPLKAHERLEKQNIGTIGNVIARLNALEDIIKLTPTTKRRLTVFMEALKETEAN